MHPGEDFGWRQLQPRGELPCVCITPVFQPGACLMKRLSFSPIQIQSHRVEVFAEPSPTAVENVRNMINKAENPEQYIVSYKSEWNE